MSIMLPKRVPTSLRRREKEWTSRARGKRTLARRSGPECFGSSMTPSVGGARAFRTVLLVVVRYGRLAGPTILAHLARLVSHEDLDTSLAPSGGVN